MLLFTKIHIVINMRKNKKLIILILLIIIIIPIAYFGISMFEQQIFYDGIKQISDIENRSTDSITKDIDIVLDELKSNEIEHVLYYDLTRPELNVNVVRVIIHTMELYSIDPSRAGYRFLRV